MLPFWKTQAVPQNVQHKITVCPASSICPRELKTHAHTKMCYVNICSSTIHNSKKQKQSNCWWTDEWISCGIAIQYSIILPQKGMKYWLHITTWMNLQDIMLNERNQSQKITFYVSPCIWNFQNGQIQRDRK
jgi:hypothetical protein